MEMQFQIPILFFNFYVIFLLANYWNLRQERNYGQLETNNNNNNNTQDINIAQLKSTRLFYNCFILTNSAINDCLAMDKKFDTLDGKENLTQRVCRY